MFHVVQFSFLPQLSRSFGTGAVVNIEVHIVLRKFEIHIFKMERQKFSHLLLFSEALI